MLSVEWSHTFSFRIVYFQPGTLWTYVINTVIQFWHDLYCTVVSLAQITTRFYNQIFPTQVKTWLTFIRFPFIRLNIGCNKFIIYRILHLTSFQILYFGLSEFSWQICPVSVRCPDSVRNFVKMMSDVCLSGFFCLDSVRCPDSVQI